MNWNILQRKNKETEETDIGNNNKLIVSAYILESVPETFLYTISCNPLNNSVRWTVNMHNK